MLPIEELKKREFNIFELMAISKTVYKTCFKSILDISILLGLPINIFLSYIIVSMFNFMDANNIVGAYTNVEQMKNLLVNGTFEKLGLYYIVIIAVQGALIPLVTMAVARVTEDLLYGKITRSFDAIKESFSCGAVLIIASLIYEFIIFTGLMLFIIPAIFFYVTLYFYSYAIILDKKGTVEALKYSYILSKGRFLKTAVPVFVIFVMDYSINNLISYVFAVFNMGVAGDILAGIVSITISCFFLVTSTLFYVNRKAVAGECPNLGN